MYKIYKVHIFIRNAFTFTVFREKVIQNALKHFHSFINSKVGLSFYS